MPNRNKQRGYELEAACRDFWLANGFTARRTLASGAYKQQLGDDHAADLWIEDFSVEAKRKKSGFKFLYDSLAQDDASMLCIKQDRCDRVYVLREQTLLQLMQMAYCK
jgi:hypothetical protein